MISVITNKTKYEIVQILLIISAVLLAIMAFYLPKINKINLCNKEIANLNRIVEKLQKTENNTSEFKDKERQIIGELDIINEKIPLQAMIPRVIEEILKPLKELDISLIAITPQEHIKVDAGEKDILDINTSEKIEEKVSCFRTSIELSINATYKQFGMYLDKIRHLPRLVVVEGFSIDKNKNSASKLDIKLKISVFHYGKD